jgi:hypothetical protein
MELLAGIATLFIAAIVIARWYNGCWYVCMACTIGAVVLLLVNAAAVGHDNVFTVLFAVLVVIWLPRTLRRHLARVAHR